MRLAVAFVVCIALGGFMSACGGNTMSPSSAATMAIPRITAWSQSSGSGFLYFTDFYVVETSGTTGAQVTAFAFSLDNGIHGSVTADNGSVLPFRVLAGGSSGLWSFHISDVNNPKPLASSITVSAQFTDDHGNTGTATTSLAVVPPQ
jgi:hypothetical protein